ncbi:MULTISPECIES: FAD-dependent oxidoreductase [Actinomadura]|uniref:FAD-dependent oxidoreductase n=1 Tax=Actinomadura yumaensis TaxID=111807 RepID=A0ABW2CNG3_9ACTN|nr:FAD-dependent oxidoreductase [Actinomadura sp. J1-007]MWK36755.1 FAD-dependent oxidoreductase [Actinomadura sp. J1-007]
MDESVPVLIVGGGYAGLASALFLSHHGVRCTLVDRHPGVSVQGRARGINQRTMELYRPLGIEPRIREAGRPFDGESGVVRCASLAGEWTWLLGDDARAPLPDLTACGFGMADQRTVEPILIDAARARGADIRFGARCLSAEPGPDGITATVADATGARHTIRADRLIAADGFRGTIGPSAGITREGPGVTQSWVTFLVEADLSEIVTKRAMFWIVMNPELGGFGSFLTTSVEGQWAVSFTYDPARESPSDFTAERCAKAARTVIGRDVPLEILDIACWEEAVGVADAFRSGDVFLVGDSAHVWPPAGAMGANAAVQDAHNLAWKLAAVINGWASPSLLDTYEAERRPAAQALAGITVRRQEARFSNTPVVDDVDDTLCTLGQRYNSSAVLGPAHPSVYGDDLAQHAAPGTRAPHLWLSRAGARITVHDLFHDAFTLLTGPGGAPWVEAAYQVAAETAVPLRGFRVGPEGDGIHLIDVDHAWEPRYRLGPTGAALVRPDGYVAWRSPSLPDSPATALADALHRILHA